MGEREGGAGAGGRAKSSGVVRRGGRGGRGRGGSSGVDEEDEEDEEEERVSERASASA